MTMAMKQFQKSKEHTKRVLVVEDEWIVALDLTMFLTDAGYKVIGPASRVSDALALLEKEDIDAAILDINLSGETSKPIALHLKNKGTPFVFLTGYSRGHLDPELSSEIVVNKPLSQTQLHQALEGLFAMQG